MAGDVPRTAGEVAGGRAAGGLGRGGDGKRPGGGARFGRVWPDGRHQQTLRLRGRPRRAQLNSRHPPRTADRRPRPRRRTDGSTSDTSARRLPRGAAGVAAEDEPATSTDASPPRSSSARPIKLATSTAHRGSSPATAPPHGRIHERYERPTRSPGVRVRGTSSTSIDNPMRHPRRPSQRVVPWPTRRRARLALAPPLGAHLFRARIDRTPPRACQTGLEAAERTPLELAPQAPQGRTAFARTRRRRPSSARLRAVVWGSCGDSATLAVALHALSAHTVRDIAVPGRARYPVDGDLSLAFPTRPFGDRRDDVQATPEPRDHPPWSRG